MKRSFDFRPWLKPALTVLLGLLLIFRPGSITNSIALCAGIILALFGAGKLIGFFTQSGALCHYPQPCLPGKAGGAGDRYFAAAGGHPGLYGHHRDA